MPILSNNPLTVDGKVFDRLAVYLAISPAFKEDDLGPSFVVNAVRYRKDEDGAIEQYPDDRVSLVYSTLAHDDSALEGKVRELMDAVQDILNQRGL
jgi:hypothetical protein